MKSLPDQLDPDVFVRIHHSCIVNVQRIRELQPWAHGDYVVILNDGRRPMRRVTIPLRAMGARFIEENGDGLPITVEGGSLSPLDYTSPTASAQVKGSLIFAG